MLRGRHVVAADQLGVEQGFRPQRMAGVVVSSAALAAFEAGRPFPGRPSSQLVGQLSGAGSFQE
jgi:hypothetical protein